METFAIFKNQFITTYLECVPNSGRTISFLRTKITPDCSLDIPTSGDTIHFFIPKKDSMYGTKTYS